MLFIDSAYRTGLGIAFYDRQNELRALDEMLSIYKIIVVYGPRNVGKSELVRYWSAKQARHTVVTFHADLLRSGKSVEGITKYLVTIETRLRELLLSELAKLSFEKMNLLKLVYTIYDIVRTMSRSVVLFIDEFHMLPGYGPRGDYEEILMDLEALAHWLAKSGDDKLKVLLTVSEGFVATGDAISRLHGYSTEFMLVEPMDEQHFVTLYEEYRRVKGCNVDHRTIYVLVGGSPGYLIELCQGYSAVARFVERSKRLLQNALSNVKSSLMSSPWNRMIENLDLRNLLKLIRKAMDQQGLDPVEQPLLYTVGQLLTKYNVAYPYYAGGRVIFKPQIPLYHTIIEIAVSKSLEIPSITVNDILTYREHT